MKKRTLSFLLVLLMCLSLMPMTVMAANDNLTRAELAELLYDEFHPTAIGAGATFNDIGDCTPAQQTAIKALAAAGMLSGSSEGMFDPHGIVTRGMSALLIWRISGIGTSDENVIFNDIAETPYAPAINALVSCGVLLPSDAIDGEFKPGDAATEQVVREWLSRLDTEGDADSENTGSENAGNGNTGSENTGSENSGSGSTGNENTGETGIGKSEYEASSWAQEELARAEELGLIPESLQSADLREDITRAEFAAVSVKVYESLSGTKALPAVINPFTDTADLEVLKAYNVGITNGMGDGTVYVPDALLNREQAATMLTRVYKRVTMPGWTLTTDSQFTLQYTKPALFGDDRDISGWAKDSVYFMAANKIIEGWGGNFAPKNVTTQQEAEGYANATREQALLIAVRMVENLSK